MGGAARGAGEGQPAPRGARPQARRIPRPRVAVPGRRPRGHPAARAHGRRRAGARSAACPAFPPKSNLVTRAIELFRRRAGAERGRGVPRSTSASRSAPGSAAARAMPRPPCGASRSLFGSPLDADEIADCAARARQRRAVLPRGPGRRRGGAGRAPARPSQPGSTSPSSRSPRGRGWPLPTPSRGSTTIVPAAAAGEPASTPTPIAARVPRRSRPDPGAFSNSFDGLVMGRLAAVAAIRERMRAAGAPRRAAHRQRIDA